MTVFRNVYKHQKNVEKFFYDQIQYLGLCCAGQTQIYIT